MIKHFHSSTDLLLGHIAFLALLWKNMRSQKVCLVFTMWDDMRRIWRILWKWWREGTEFGLVLLCKENGIVDMYRIRRGRRWQVEGTILRDMHPSSALHFVNVPIPTTYTRKNQIMLIRADVLPWMWNIKNACKNGGEREKKIQHKQTKWKQIAKVLIAVIPSMFCFLFSFSPFLSLSQGVKTNTKRNTEKKVEKKENKQSAYLYSVLKIVSSMQTRVRSPNQVQV